MKSFRTSLLRSIRGSLGRFLAIAAIVALGCGFYGGLRMTGPDMRAAADRFYDGTHLYDIRTVSTLGYSDSQIEDIAAIEGVSAVMPSKTTDVMGQVNEEQYAVRISSLPLDALNSSSTDDGCNVESDDSAYLNRLVLVEGRWPTKAGECVVSADRVSGVDIQMGDTLQVLYGPQDIDDVLEIKEFVIVGTAHSSSFVSAVTMGATSLGSGSIQQFAYVSKDSFLEDYPYSEFFLEVEGARELFSGSDEYDDHLAEVVSRLEGKSQDMAESRLKDLKDKAQDELDSEKATFETEKADALQKLDDAKKELDDAKREIDENQKKLDDAEQEIADGQKQIDDGRKQLEEGLAELENQRNTAITQLNSAIGELNDSQAQYDAGRAELESKRSEVENWPQMRAQLETQLEEARSGYTAAQEGIQQLDAAISQLETQLAALPADDPSRSQIEAQLATTRETRNETLAQSETAQAAIAQLEEGIAQGDTGAEQFAASEQELNQAKEQLDSGWSTYDAEEKNAGVKLQDAEKTIAQSQQELADSEQKLAEARQEFEDGKKKLEEGKQEYQDGLKEYEEERADALEKIRDAEDEIAEAQQDIDELEAPDIYVLDRSKNYGVASQVADSERIDNIGKVFPFIFFLVAALVALTTMTRMVEEERTLIGTFKALGYSKARITSRYLIYAGAASIAGAVVGLALLSQILPFVIARAYAIIYNIPDYPLPLPIDWPLALLAGGLGVGVTLLSTVAAAVATLREQPASLMLPRAPKAGKRIILERLTPLWKRLSFSWKVTLRNLFRYKKRLFMTAVGIAGCTALLLTGWGLHDAIWDIIDKQYGPVVNYNIIVKLDDESTDEQVHEVEQLMEDEGDTQDITRVQGLNMQLASDSHDALGVEVVVPSDTQEFSKLLTMKDRVSQQPISFDSKGVVLTEKLARTLEVGVGDVFRLHEQDDMGNPLGAGFELTVTGVMENYIGNWAYIGQETYEEATGNTCRFTTLYGRCTDDLDVRSAFTDNLHDLDAVQTVSYNDETIDKYRTMLTSVDMIVVVLVVSAAALAFIVLYNLTNINITERRREIASLKVLGFTKREVYAYIFREIGILSVVGALLGLGLGVLLEAFVVVTAEVDYVMFGRDIHLPSFIVSFAMTLLFSFVAMLFMRRKLRDIDMVESLKSID